MEDSIFSLNRDIDKLMSKRSSMTQEQMNNLISDYSDLYEQSEILIIKQTELIDRQSRLIDSLMRDIERLTKPLNLL